MNTLTEETFLGESVDCQELGEGIILEFTDEAAKIYLEDFDMTIELPLDEIEIEEETDVEDAGDDVQDLDELSKGTLGSYINKSANSMRNANQAVGRRDKGKYFGNARVEGGDEQNKMHQDQKRIAKNREKGIKTAATKLAREETVTEARGRPPKKPAPGQKPTAAWLRHLERQKGGQEKEEFEALGAQLRKATSINKPVTFMNGDKKEIHPKHANAFHDHMAARPRTIDKQKFQNAAHKSHADFVKHVTAPLPKSEGGRSSIVNYK